MSIFPIRSMVVLLCLALAVPAAYGQNPPPGAAVPAAPIYTPKQLDQLLAPIALYPDQLLTQVLIAATYPQQIVDAGTWLQDPNNAKLSGDALVAALQPLDWDPSVKSLIAFPQVIATLNQHMDWTEALGIAFANQQADTMAQIQVLRQQASRAGTLKTTRQLAVTTEGSDIIIEPGETSMVYVPVYNPATVYGDWQYADYPPVYLPPPPSYTGTVGGGIGYGVGFVVVAPLWGVNRPDWRSHEVNVDRNRYTGLSANHQPPPARTWQHQGPFVPASLPATRPAAPAFQHPPGTVVPSAVTVPGRVGGAPAAGTTTPAPSGATPAVTTPPAHEAPAHPPGTGATPAFTTPPAHEAPVHPQGTTPAVTTPPAHEAPAHPQGTTPAVTTPPAHEAPAHPQGTTPAVTTPPAHEAPAHPQGTTPAVTTPPAHEAPVHPQGTTPAVTTPPAHEAPAHPQGTTPAVTAPPQHEAPPHPAAPAVMPAPPPHPAPPPPAAAAPPHPAPPPAAAPAAHPAPPAGSGAPPPKRPPGQGEEPPK